LGPSSRYLETTLPAADFCRPVRIDRSTLSPDSGTNGRSPEVSSTAFRTQPADLQPVPLMDMGFAVIRPLARHCMPLIRFLYIGSYVCSTLLSDPASRRRRCASLSLHLHQVVKRTFTSKLSNMLGTRNYPPAKPGALETVSRSKRLRGRYRGPAKPLWSDGTAWRGAHYRDFQSYLVPPHSEGSQNSAAQFGTCLSEYRIRRPAAR
jgi:hypothetical protein